MAKELSKEGYEATLSLVQVVCGVLLEDDGKYLLVQEKQLKAFKK